MSPTIKRIADDLARSAPVTYRLPLCFGSWRIDIESMTGKQSQEKPVG